MEISGLVGGIAAAVLVPVIMQKLNAANHASRRSGEFKVVEFGTGYRALMGFAGLFFLTLAGLAYNFPGKTEPSELKLAIGVFLFFALLGLGTLLLTWRATVYWNEREVQGANAWGKRGAFHWEELAGAEYVGWMQCVRLRSARGVCIYLSPMAKGFWELDGHLRRVCPGYRTPPTPF